MKTLFGFFWIFGGLILKPSLHPWNVGSGIFLAAPLKANFIFAVFENGRILGNLRVMEDPSKEIYLMRFFKNLDGIDKLFEFHNIVKY
ncbi:hypothetical protein [Methanothermobacter tenebrarum]|uniref:Uncharacterized protein n=1 Tax=Methanothermobacter tenebrarum TaxID=680118 RepID=A0A328PIT7_9EURY|nr:hypothetical protein [Methanothermobacter tenebrarum]RAO79324.1 hypothetical protein DPC56_03150 [Methanothermobacter tenebrarum]